MIKKCLFLKTLQITSFLTFCCLFVAAQQSYLTNADIINLVKSNVSETVILAKIKNSKCECDTSSIALIKLKENKVSDNLIVAMIEANQKNSDETEKNEPKKEEAKNSDSKPVISPTSIFVSTTASDIDLFPEKFEGKVTYLRAKVENVSRQEEGIFSVSLSTGSVTYGNDYKYFPSILGRSSISFIAYNDMVETLLTNKKYGLDATIGGWVTKIGDTNSPTWVFYIFNVNGVVSNSNLLNTAFIARIQLGLMYPQILAVFINKGADINVKNKDEQTPIILSTIGEYKAIVKELIKAKAKLDEVDKSGKTALIYAVESNIEDIVKELIKAGADVSIKDKTGKTAVDYAVGKDKNIVKLLKK